MLFNSYVFLFGFLPAVLLGWWGLARLEAAPARLPDRRVVVLLCLVGLALPAGLIGATSIDYVAGHFIAATEDERGGRLLLTASLTTNIGILVYFKYAGFFLGTLDGIGCGWPAAGVASLHIVLPIGISFYTFNSMSYTIDIFRRRIEPTRQRARVHDLRRPLPAPDRWADRPLQRPAGQLRRLTPRLTSANAARGAYFISCGLVKKLLIADQLSPHVDRLYAAHAHLGLADRLGGGDRLLAPALLRLLRLLGHGRRARPSCSASASRRTSTRPSRRSTSRLLAPLAHEPLLWFRDYLFIPLGGYRAGRETDGGQPVVMMPLVGLWHGAGWTSWSGGSCTASSSAAMPFCAVPAGHRASVAFNRAVTFLLVCAAFVIFRAPSLGVAGEVLSSMAGLHGLDSPTRLAALVPVDFALLLAALLVFVHAAPNTWQIRLRPRVSQGVAAGVAAALAVMTIAQPHPFLYFQF